MTKLTEATEIFVPRYHKLQEILQAHERAHWGIWEIDVRKDVEQWRSGVVTPEQKAFITMILRFFTQADTNVSAGYVERLLPVFKNADARMMLLSFASRESTHMLGYKFLNDNLGLDSEAFSSEFLQVSELKAKHEFMVESVDMRSDKGRAEYLAKQVLMEGVNLFASFAMLLTFRRMGLTPGQVDVNIWSQVDESWHVAGLVELFKIFLSEHPRIVNDEFKRKIYETQRQVVALEHASIDVAFNAGNPGNLDRQDVKDYICFVSDYRMKQMGFKPQYNIAANPLPWIDDLTGDMLGDFFDTTITGYSKGNLQGEWEY
jgi:ribonucleotide reductase beta subunit family protein with ferritin-like domain